MGDVVQISVSNAWSSGVDTWIDSVSYTWNVNPPYFQGDLLEVDESSVPPIFLQNINIIIIILIAVGLTAALFLLSSKIKRNKSKTITQQKPMLNLGEKKRKKIFIETMKGQNLIKLSEILQMSNRMNIQDVADLLALHRSEVLNILIENRKNLDHVKIDGDFIVVSSKEDMDAFVEILDAQFQSWNKKGKK